MLNTIDDCCMFIAQKSVDIYGKVTYGDKYSLAKEISVVLTPLTFAIGLSDGIQSIGGVALASIFCLDRSLVLYNFACEHESKLGGEDKGVFAKTTPLLWATGPAAISWKLGFHSATDYASTAFGLLNAAAYYVLRTRHPTIESPVPVRA
jgi:hypothetical protein